MFIHRKVNRKSGFSILELVIVIGVMGIFISIFSSSITNLYKLGQHFLEFFEYRSNYLFFIIKFEEDFYHADVINVPTLSTDPGIIFYKDIDNDSSYGDINETISYELRADSKSIYRSRRARFQEVLRGIEDIEINIEDTAVGSCLNLRLKNVFSSNFIENLMCRSF